MNQIVKSVGIAAVVAAVLEVVAVLSYSLTLFVCVCKDYLKDFFHKGLQFLNWVVVFQICAQNQVVAVVRVVEVIAVVALIVVVVVGF